MKKLKIATVFSGIGALEESLRQLEIPHVIKFACDNGEREPKQTFETVYKVACDVLEVEDVQAIIDNLINLVFRRPTDNPLIEEQVNEYYNIVHQLELQEKVEYMDALDDMLDGENVVYSFKLAYSDLPEVLKNYPEEQVSNFVERWYNTTKKINYVKESYTKNYTIENNNWYEDVRFLNGKTFRGDVDLFMGGSPCQSFSTYGKKRGLEDARGTLFYDFARLISEIQPKAFIYENVRGLLTHDNKKTWGVIYNIFDSLGYDFDYKVLDAQNYGLPQMRVRVFVVGIRKDISKGRKFVFPEPIPLTTRSKDYLEENVDDKYYLGQKGFEWATTPSKNRNKTRVNREIIGCQTANQQDNWIGDLRIEDPNPEHYNNERIYIGRYDGKPAVARKMTPKECLNLMGFKNFKITVDDIRMYRQAGNSIAVPVLNALVRQLKPYLKYEINDNNN